MAKKISELTAITTIADNDLTPIVDTSETETKKMTASQMKTYAQGDLNTRLTTVETNINNISELATHKIYIAYDTYTISSYTTWGSLFTGPTQAKIITSYGFKNVPLVIPIIITNSSGLAHWTMINSVEKSNINYTLVRGTNPNIASNIQMAFIIISQD